MIIRALFRRSIVVAMVVLPSACALPSAGPNAGVASAALAPALPSTSTPAIGAEAAAVADNKVEITFPRGGTTLTTDANKKLDLAARLYRDANPVVMFTTGYTDRSGDEYGNLLVSAKRAEAVKRGLVARGIPPEKLLIQALGESELANTSDPLSAENRRVVITWRLL